MTNAISEALGFRAKKAWVRCLGCVVTLAQDFAPFGAVRSASLFLEGCLVRGAVCESSDDGDRVSYNVWLEYAHDCVSGYLDEHGSTASSQTPPPVAVVWSLMVSSYKKDWSGLLLVKMDDHVERYRRVGWCHGRLHGKAERFWPEQPRRVIELV